MFLTTLVEVDLARAELTAPAVNVSVPAIVGRDGATPPGIYLLRRAHSAQLRMDILVFIHGEHEVWAIHPSIPSRNAALYGDNPAARRLSRGCVGIEQAAFDALWNTRGEIVLQVHSGESP